MSKCSVFENVLLARVNMIALLTCTKSYLSRIKSGTAMCEMGVERQTLWVTYHRCKCTFYSLNVLRREGREGREITESEREAVGPMRAHETYPAGSSLICASVEG